MTDEALLRQCREEGSWKVVRPLLEQQARQLNAADLDLFRPLFKSRAGLDLESYPRFQTIEELHRAFFPERRSVQDLDFFLTLATEREIEGLGVAGKRASIAGFVYYAEAEPVSSDSGESDGSGSFSFMDSLDLGRAADWWATGIDVGKLTWLEAEFMKQTCGRFPCPARVYLSFDQHPAWDTDARRWRLAFGFSVDHVEFLDPAT